MAVRTAKAEESSHVADKYESLKLNAIDSYHLGALQCLEAPRSSVSVRLVGERGERSLQPFLHPHHHRLPNSLLLTLWDILLRTPYSMMY